jgi:hypothetical protein
VSNVTVLQPPAREEMMKHTAISPEKAVDRLSIRELVDA